jgi:hypothetical protein
LFEDDRFTANQNNLAYLVTCDPNTNIKDDGKSLYLGVFEESSTVGVNLNSTITMDIGKIFPDDQYTWSIIFDDPAVEAKYGKFFNLDTATGLLTLTEPDVVLPEDTKLEIVQFKARASTSRLTATSANIFFFHTNPMYKETLDQNDVTLALTNTNSISFYGYWSLIIK